TGNLHLIFQNFRPVNLVLATEEFQEGEGRLEFFGTPHGPAVKETELHLFISKHQPKGMIQQKPPAPEGQAPQGYFPKQGKAPQGGGGEIPNPGQIKPKTSLGTQENQGPTEGPKAFLDLKTG